MAIRKIDVSHGKLFLHVEFVCSTPTARKFPLHAFNSDSKVFSKFEKNRPAAGASSLFTHIPHTQTLVEHPNHAFGFDRNVTVVRPRKLDWKIKVA